MIYKITFLKILKQFLFLFNIFIVCLVVMVITYYFDNSIFDNLIYITLLSYSLLILFVVTLIIIIQYYIHNRGVSLTIEENDWNIKYCKNDLVKIIKLEDIKSIHQVRTPTFAEKRITYMPWEHLNYSLISLKTDEKIIITSLLVENLEFPKRFHNVTLKKVLLPIIEDY